MKDPDLHKNARTDEWFFYSKFCPRVLFHVNLIIAMLTVWWPYPFASMYFGWFLNYGRKVHAIQLYFGIKCDGSRTRDMNPWAFDGKGNFIEDLVTRWVMVLTPKEWVAGRLRWITYNKEWNNEAG